MNSIDRKLTIKSPQEIEKMRELGKILAAIVDNLAQNIVPNTNLLDLEDKAQQLCSLYKVNPSCVGYNNYPNAICVGVNEQAVHCIPQDRKVKAGDIVTIDMVIDRDGWFVDHAVTLLVGNSDKGAELLVNTAYKAMELAIEKAVIDNTTGDLGYTMESAATEQGFSVLREMIGHGIGRAMHEFPPVPCYGKPGEGVGLVEGMVITIEPMITEHNPDLEVASDGWSTKTKDGGRFAMFEHTVAITKSGPFVLTRQ